MNPGLPALSLQLFKSPTVQVGGECVVVRAQDMSSPAINTDLFCDLNSAYGTAYIRGGQLALAPVVFCCSSGVAPASWSR